MIAADTSTWVAYLAGETGDDVELLDRALQDQHAVMIPAVLSELLSDPKLSPKTANILVGLPLIRIESGYWERTAFLRAKVLMKGRRARLGDALIAQCCIDQRIPLLTRDRDFRAFSAATGADFLIKY